MKKRILLILLSIMILFTSCDLTMKEGPKPKMYLIINGLGYEELYATALNNPINDANGIFAQFRELCKAGGNEYEIVWYSDSLEKSMAPANSTYRYTFTHYNDKSDKPTCAPIRLTRYGKIRTVEEFETRYFSIIDSLWDEKPSEDDLIIFYYTGHGVDSFTNENSAGPVLYYVTENVILTDGTIKPQLTEFIGLSYDRIFRNMDAYPARQLFIIDCCYSGASGENRSEILPRDDNELGYVLSFRESYDGKIRNDYKTRFQLDAFMTDSWNHTFKGAYGKPRRMVLNASTYAQQSMNADPYRNSPGINHYGGFTYRLLKYLGYHITDDLENDGPREPGHYPHDVITVSSMLDNVYNGISSGLREMSTPNMTRSSYDMVIWDFR